MTFELKPGKYSTEAGDAHIYAQNADDGWWYGRVQSSPTCWQPDGDCMGTLHCAGCIACNILPPAPVKKYGWIMKDVRGELRESFFSHATAEAAEESFNKGLGVPAWKAIARIEGSEIEE